MSDFMRRTWVQIDLDAIHHNYNKIREAVSPQAGIMAVVKADAYGHGVEYSALELSKAGADWFAVSNLEEAFQVRRAGIDKPILILGYTPPEYALQLAVNNISQAVFCYEYGKRLSEEAVKAGIQVNMHIKVDTGMTRIGFSYQDNVRDAGSVDEIEEICSLPGLYPEGIFTHFASADEGNGGEEYTRIQFELFMNMTERLSARGINFDLRHCCNSAGIIEYPEMHLDLVRPGIILYGLSPSDDLRKKLDLRPVMELKSVVSMVKTIEEGTCVSYGRSFVSGNRMKIATVPVGYADGYPRNLSNVADVLINGFRAPVVGRVCMDQLMVDVTEFENVSQGTTVTVFGKDGEESITADELAQKGGIINYEILCGISRRVPRIYMRNGKIENMMDYLMD